MTSSNLPFELSTPSISDWLLTLSKFNSVKSANELNKVIKSLRNTQYESKKVLHTLTQLTPTVLFIDSTIESSLLAEAKQNNGKISLKIEKLCIQLLRNLSLAFSVLAEDEALSTEEKTHTVYIALQLIGYTQRITSIFHEFPSSTLWRETAKLYTLAKNTATEKQAPKQKIKEFKTLSTIESVLQRNLLFSLLAPYQFTSHQIQTLFTLSDQQAQLLLLNQQYSTESNFIWDLDNGIAPIAHHLNSMSNDTTINIDLSKFLAFIQSTQFTSQQINGTLLDEVINTVSCYKKTISSSIPAIFSISHLINGPDEITAFLNDINKLKKIQQFSSQLPDAKPVSSMTLEPMEFEKSHFKPKAELTPSSNHIEIPKNASTVKILQTKYQQYVIAILDISTYSIGNLILLYKPDEEPKLGIIRHILFVETSNSTQILIEKIKGTLSSHVISSTKSTNEPIIMVHNDDTAPELFIAPSKLANGTLIQLSLEQAVTLDKLVDYSPFYMHYQT